LQAKDEIAAAERPELIFALVGPAGVRLDDLSQALKDHLKAFGYKAFDIRLSNLLNNFTGRTEDPTSDTSNSRESHTDKKWVTGFGGH